MSGSDWNNEKLQKYLSARSLSIPRNSSGTCFIDFVSDMTSLHTLQYMDSISALVRRSTIPMAKRLNASSCICSASCQSSSMERWSILHHISYNSLTSWWSPSFASNSSGISGSEVLPRTSITNTLWCADNERPLSVIRLGWGKSFLSAASTKVYMQSFTYSCML